MKQAILVEREIMSKLMYIGGSKLLHQPTGI
jgi:hypothetical protein